MAKHGFDLWLIFFASGLAAAFAGPVAFVIAAVFGLGIKIWSVAREHA